MGKKTNNSVGGKMRPTTGKRTVAKSAPPKKQASSKKTKTTSKSQLLGVIAQMTTLHGGAHAAVSQDLVARRAGYGNGGNPSYKKALNRAQKQNLLVLGTSSETGEPTVVLTNLGLDQAGDASDFIVTNAAAQEVLFKDLSPKMQKAFELMTHGKPVQRTFLATELGYGNANDGGFKKLLCRMRSKGAVEFLDAEDCVQLADLAFPEGRPEMSSENPL